MAEQLFYVLKAGLQTTFQDLGRTGYQEFGVVVAGAMDPFSSQIANILVGNPKDEAVLEITMMGPRLKVLGDAVISICGGDLSPRVNGEAAPMWKSFQVSEGDLLEFGQPKQGIRAYLSVAGGFELSVVMGSKATYLKAGIGGLEGRALQKDDILLANNLQKKNAGRGLIPAEIPQYPKEMKVRVVMGPHQDAFTEEAVDTFLSATYQVTPQSDRMGYQLKGPVLAHKQTADILSEAIPLGGIQVPANGQPIILMADRQTTGGYTRIATVISADIPLLAQAQPGTVIRFEAVSVEKAQEIYERKEQFISMVERTAAVNV